MSIRSMFSRKKFKGHGFVEGKYYVLNTGHIIGPMNYHHMETTNYPWIGPTIYYGDKDSAIFDDKFEEGILGRTKVRVVGECDIETISKDWRKRVGTITLIQRNAENTGNEEVTYGITRNW